MDVAFIKIRLGFFAFLKISCIFEHDFPFFVERPSPHHCLEKFLSLLLFPSRIYVALFIHLIKCFLLQLLH